jgi:hypothetical protein
VEERHDARRPFGTVAASAVEGFRTLVRQQIELAKLEIIEAISVRAVGIGMMLGAGVLLAYAAGFMAVAVAAGLAVVLPRWAAYLIVAVLLVGAAATLVLLGRRVIRTAPSIERTPDTLKEDARWAQQQIAR